MACPLKLAVGKERKPTAPRVVRVISRLVGCGHLALEVRYVILLLLDDVLELPNLALQVVVRLLACEIPQTVSTVSAS